MKPASSAAVADGFCRLEDRWAAVKAFLMHQDRDVDLGSDLPPIAGAVIADLEVDALLTAMAAGDEFLRGMARRAMLSGLADPEAIGYRQQVLSDAIAHPDVVRELYDIAVTAITSEKRNFFYPLTPSPDLILHWSVQVLEMLTGMLKRLRAVADTHGKRTFRLLEGQPLPTSYGPDLYAQIFGGGPEALPREEA